MLARVYAMIRGSIGSYRLCNAGWSLILFTVSRYVWVGQGHGMPITRAWNVSKESENLRRAYYGAHGAQTIVRAWKSHFLFKIEVVLKEMPDGNVCTKNLEETQLVEMQGVY